MARRALSRDRIIRAAVRVADTQGLEALSMRRLGRTLGYEAMSLYNHVEGKEDLVRGMLDLVLLETEAPPRDRPWDEAIRQSAVSVHRMFQRHAWACALLLSAEHLRPGRLRYMDALLGCLRGAGFTAETTYHAYHALDAHIFGFFLWHAGHGGAGAMPEDARTVFDRIVPADVYPHLREHGEQHLTAGPHREVSAFEFGLDLILDGLKKLRP